MNTKTPPLNVVAVALAVFANVGIWLVVALTPLLVRRSISREEFDTVYHLPILLGTIVIILNAMALILGIVALRRYGSKPSSAVAVCLSAMIFIGVLVYAGFTFTPLAYSL